MASMARGKAASELAVPKAIDTGSATAAMNFFSGTRTSSATGNSTPTNENQQRDVEGEQQLSEVEQDAHAGAAHRIGDGRAHAQRSHVHDEISELEHRLGEALGKVQQRPATLLAHHGQGDAEQDAEHDDLEYLAFRNGFRQVLGEDVQDGFRGRHSLDLERFAAGRRQMYPYAGLAEVDGGEPDEQRRVVTASK